MKLYLCLKKRYLEAAHRFVAILKPGFELSLSKNDEERFSHPFVKSTFSPNEADLIVSIGGDGAFLKAASIALEADKPVIGINAGRVGYLCSLNLNDLTTVDESTFTSLKHDYRSTLKIEYNGQAHYAINDVCFGKEVISATLQTKCCLGDKLIGEFIGDGIIISTPAGSTAYNLSSGGPILDLDSKSFVLTPICTPNAHSYVFNENDEVSVYLYPRSKALVSVDSETLGKASEEYKIKKGEKQLCILV